MELFEAFDHPEESLPKPVHTRFKDGDGDEEDENGVGDAGPRERLRQSEETIERLRAENILPARWARRPGVGWGPCPSGRGRRFHGAGTRCKLVSPPPAGWEAGVRVASAAPGPRRRPPCDPHPDSLLPSPGPGPVFRVISDSRNCSMVVDFLESPAFIFFAARLVPGVLSPLCIGGCRLVRLRRRPHVFFTYLCACLCRASGPKM